MKAIYPFINVIGLLLLAPFGMLADWLRSKVKVACDHQLENGWYLLKGTCKTCGKEVK